MSDPTSIPGFPIENAVRLVSGASRYAYELSVNLENVVPYGFKSKEHRSGTLVQVHRNIAMSRALMDALVRYDSDLEFVGKMFPLMVSTDRGKKSYPCPTEVPWLMLAAHEEQAQKNHYQSLSELARRGGLCPEEMVCVLKDEAFNMGMSYTICVDYIMNSVEQWNADQRK